MRRSSSASAQSMARSRAIFARSNRIRMRARFCGSASGTWVRTLRSSTCTAWGGPYTVPERRRLTNACSRPTSQSSNLHAQICRLSGGRLMRAVRRMRSVLTDEQEARTDLRLHTDLPLFECAHCLRGAVDEPRWALFTLSGYAGSKLVFGTVAPTEVGYNDAVDF